MNYYVIKKNRKDYEIEKFSESEWAKVEDKLDKNNIVHITNDLSDPKIQHYELKEIIWGRLFNKCSCNYRKVYISLSTDIEQMEKYWTRVEKDNKNAMSMAMQFANIGIQDNLQKSLAICFSAFVIILFFLQV